MQRGAGGGVAAIRKMPARDFPNRHSGSASASNGVVFFDFDPDPDGDFDGFEPVCDILRIAGDGRVESFDRLACLG